MRNPLSRLPLLIAVTGLMVGGLPTARAADSAAMPKVAVENIRRVFHDGNHNAFTDLVRFANRFYLTFRSCPDGHMVHPTSCIIVLVSDDAQNWRETHRFSAPLRDTRDPHFLVFKNRLFVYTGTWFSGPTTLAREDYDLNKHLGFAAWTEDGQQWRSPVMLEGTFGHYIWRANQWNDKAYLCGRRKAGFAIGPRGEGDEVESLMLESDDGLIWRKAAVFQQREGDDTAFLFQSDGSLIGIGRRGRANAQLLQSSPPFEHFVRTDLDRYIGGPLIAQWNQRLVVAGRHNTVDRGPKTSFCWLVNGQLQEFAELPSGGDNSYPGFVPLSDDRALISYYSSHEKTPEGKSITAIYLAELRLLRP